jgi:predicted alpha/beta superfamily hydrolase
MCVVAGCQTRATQSSETQATPTLAALQGGYFRLDSRELNRPIHIYVSLPERYAEQADRTYPTIYIADGDSLFPMLAPTHLFLTYDEPVPPAILVGIAYGTFGDGNMRHVDFRQPGAAVYQRMLRDELIPVIEGRYRTDPERRVLVGQSRGASFVLHSALTEPDLFWGRIASNAAYTERDALWGEPAPATRRDLRLFVASGSQDNGTHAASMGEAYRQGMLWLFASN